ncbi:O-antigen polymerase [Pseudomonas sp. OF001]|uniref:O-antigen polymerase n=1 Tax=Pseudomonas sp. OF001 TaxID=2772300 RepID=UPI00191944FD|nr:O-antigen polymerase [Pseudomonas sp. OF001]
MIQTLLVSIALLIITLISIDTKNKKYALLSPPVMVNLFIILYTVIGFSLYWNGSYQLLNTDFSRTLDKIYSAINLFSILFTVAFLIFYNSKNQKSPLQADDFFLNPKLVYAYSAVLTGYAVLNLFDIKIPAFHNLILIFFNSLTVIIGYAFVTQMRGSKILTSLLVLLIIYMGFRYRLIFLFIPMLFSFFIFRRMTLLQTLKYASILILAITTISVVGVARKYSEGLQLEKLEGVSYLDMIIIGLFNDTSTVFVSGAFIDWVERTGSYAYSDQIYYILSYFIPSYFFEDKSYSPIFNYLSMMTGQSSNESGLAILGFAEYYHTAGYAGVALFSLSFAFIYAKSFRKATISNSIYYQYAYFSLLAWLVNSFTRGYLPQNTQDLAAVLFGLFFIRKSSIKVSLARNNQNTKLARSPNEK